MPSNSTEKPRPLSRKIFLCAAVMATVLVTEGIVGEKLSTRNPGHIDRQERIAMLIIPLSLTAAGMVVWCFEQRKR